MRKFTQGDRINAMRQAAMLQVIDWLNWEEADYGMYMHRMGLLYLHTVFVSPADIEMLDNAREFWGWWKLMWLQRDIEFLVKCQHAAWRVERLNATTAGPVRIKNAHPSFPADPLHSVKGRQNWYLELHDGRGLANDPQMEQSYCVDLAARLGKKAKS